jgi:thiosulfate dehydrogenase [quinone] large subunit
MTRHREIAYALLRITLGIVFLFSGIEKFRAGVGNVAGSMLQQFSGKLPAVLVQPFVYVLPFAETILGALIVLGLFTSLTLSFSGLLLVALTFGTVMLGEFPVVAHNTQYALVNFVLLWLSDLNRVSVDSVIGGGKSAANLSRNTDAK